MCAQSPFRSDMFNKCYRIEEGVSKRVSESPVYAEWSAGTKRPEMCHVTYLMTHQLSTWEKENYMEVTAIAMFHYVLRRFTKSRQDILTIRETPAHSAIALNFSMISLCRLSSFLLTGS
jgi:hypothetical protein